MVERSSHSSCIFCQIISGAAQRFLVDEDEHTLTLMDAYPVSPGHALILTRQHYPSLQEADPVAIAAVGTKSVAIARALQQVVQPEGIAVFQLNGEAAGQTVFHYHQHVLPRNRGEKLAIHSRVPGEAEELAAMAARLAAALAG